MTDLRQHIHCFILLVAVMLLVGCEREDLLENGENEQNDKSELLEREFNAYIDNGTETRTAMGGLDGDQYPVVWSKGDHVKVYSGTSSTGTECTLISGEGASKAVFKGSPWQEHTHSTSIYPVDGAGYTSKVNGWYFDGNRNLCLIRSITLNLRLPSTQAYQEGTFANNVFPMVGVCSNETDFYYENIGGVLQLPIKGDGTIARIILTGNDGEALAGDFKVFYSYHWNNGTNTLARIDNLESEIPEEEREATDRKITVTNGKEAVIVDCGEDGLKLDPVTPTMVNIVILPKTFRKGFTVRFIDKDNSGSFTKTTSKPITVKRSYVKTMEAFDYQKPEPLETANCYVVDKAGYYVIPAFCMGNRQKERLNVDENGNNKATNNPVAADYLWTDITDYTAITDIQYISGKDGYISFRVKPDANGNDPRGNTVIALYDSKTKEIIWSWHIWMSDFKETRINGSCDGRSVDGFTSTAAKENMIIMDRNLGAISANKEDGWKTYGLYYQMGRKDPFIGANSSGGDRSDFYTNKNHQDDKIGSYIRYEEDPFSNITNKTNWNTNLTSGWVYVKEFITAIHGYQHPMDYASSWKDSKDTRWTNKDSNTLDPFMSQGGHEDFWNRSKTINDPCPAGWSILGEGSGSFGKPDENLSKVYCGNGIYGLDAVYTIKNVDNYTVWWPASGFRSVDGTLGNLGYGGYYWAYDHIEATHGGHGMFFTISNDSKKGVQYSYKDVNVMTNHASSVRCVKAQQPTL